MTNAIKETQMARVKTYKRGYFLYFFFVLFYVVFLFR